MPRYDYHCDRNGETIEVTHPSGMELCTWGELCYAAQYPLGDTDPQATVRKVFTPPGISVPVADSDLKGRGFTKLVKRDKGVYENMTATDKESRYMKAGDHTTLPHIEKKIED
tara:strand:+ start:195 stop:533 length:339 start_codon:yes stop_codon:yes gene_type:complete